MGDAVSSTLGTAGSSVAASSVSSLITGHKRLDVISRNLTTDDREALTTSMAAFKEFAGLHTYVVIRLSNGRIVTMEKYKEGIFIIGHSTLQEAHTTNGRGDARPEGCPRKYLEWSPTRARVIIDLLIGHERGLSQAWWMYVAKKLYYTCARRHNWLHLKWLVSVIENQAHSYSLMFDNCYVFAAQVQQLVDAEPTLIVG
eukprot:gnl/TRDRNA2_/TRDRNA2_84766_c0_seq1.p1 gnl/TRDRNA2_/TRDRNA2_84766_c0~~gnl/TRDRNA2_/TRDRNA2_84766_c0_seq1.p1  ORF type:complete len:200 (+),score=14.75 gnl/TRDRNA2_/TRDRNA2_84766_c0_seq1:85-684(+)